MALWLRSVEIGKAYQYLAAMAIKQSGIGAGSMMKKNGGDDRNNEKLNGGNEEAHHRPEKSVAAAGESGG